MNGNRAWFVTAFLTAATACNTRLPSTVDVALPAPGAPPLPTNCESEVDQEYGFKGCATLRSRATTFDKQGRPSKERTFVPGGKFDVALVWSDAGELIHITTDFISAAHGEHLSGEIVRRHEVTMSYGAHHEIRTAEELGGASFAFSWDGTFGNPQPKPRWSHDQSGAPSFHDALPNDLSRQTASSLMPPLMFDGTVTVARTDHGWHPQNRVFYVQGLAVIRYGSGSFDKYIFDRDGRILASDRAIYSDEHVWIKGGESQSTWGGDKLIRETNSRLTGTLELEWSYDPAGSLLSSVERTLGGGVISRTTWGHECTPLPIPDRCSMDPFRNQQADSK